MTDTPPAPAVSLIIPTYQRPERLTETLRALAAQTLPAARYEVIVVDDAAAEATRQVGQYGPLAGVLYLPQARQGATIARNFGAQHARGGLLIFLDDDMELSPASLEHLVAAHRELPGAVILGAFFGEEQPPKVEAGLVAVPFTKCYTGLLSVSAAIFAALDGFHDVTGGWPNWDDVEFGYRVEQAGVPLLLCREAWAVHHDASARSLTGTALRYMAAAHSAARLFQVHPGIRVQLHMFDDKGPVAWRTDRPTLAVRKLGRGVVSAWPVVHLLEWLERHTERSPFRAALRQWIIGGYIWHGYRRGLREL